MQVEEGEGFGGGEVGVGELGVFEAGKDFAKAGAGGEAVGDEVGAGE